MNTPPNHIVIVGGGTAGWMAANLMSHQWAKLNCTITLIESQAIGTVGVGEGTTPFFQGFFDRLGIQESEWMQAANATYKCGIRFPDWVSNANKTSYFHPFYSHIDSPQVPLFFANANFRREGMEVDAHPDDFFVTAKLADQCRSPIAKSDSLQRLDYGYHFDAGLLGEFLKQKGIQRGVRHIDDKVSDVRLDANGDISSVIAVNAGELTADLFVDCSGFKGLLIQQALGEEMVSYQSQLFNNSAVAIPTAIDCSEALPSETVSKALSNGWVWHIPLANRFGNGYVYSADYLSPEEAEQELRQHLGAKADGVKALHLNWTPGRITHHWKNNCIAIGLSQGFLEPLEAPMLNIIQRSIENFVELYEKSGFTREYQQEFNQDINSLIDGTRDYLQAHYKLNSREDSQYWKDCRSNINQSKELKAILDGWISNTNFDQVLRDNIHNQVYFKTSWYCILAGMDHFEEASKPAVRAAKRNHHRAKEASLAKAEGFVEHKEQLKVIYNR
ncbi:tryptophan 7-halogenase [Shewanella abyssi]|uniref:tryptophan halogenase family protein n=1 Tax=Shewanella abyssi TaxID=311789 RepID=UPI00200CD939|nr:tryptophan halogenase family protein [Shewanella abyssi]MCL1051247.1 tryptophan 7-halogenase [Shewanella abyssi]